LAEVINKCLRPLDFKRWHLPRLIPNEVGMIEAGKRADVIVLDANPLDNISNIRRVRFVVTQGRLFDSAKLWESVGFKP